MRKLTTLFLLALLPLMASAYDAEVGGIYYNLVKKAKQAEVTSGDAKYTGSINIPESFTYDGVTYSVTSIGGSAFYGCSGLTSVTIPNSVTEIGKMSFYECRKLTEVTIGSSVTTIGGAAFQYCSGLTKVHITDMAAWCKIGFYSSYSNPLSYAHHLFMDGKEIANLVIPNSVTSIGELAFYGCSGLTAVTIPNSVTSIGQGAFDGCSGLTSVTIPNSVTSIEDYTFERCSGLISITIPNSVTSIGHGAFLDCKGLTSVTIPNSVTKIGGAAFERCSKLTSVNIGSGVTTIEDYAFTDCSSLTEVHITDIAAWCKISFYKAYEESYSNPLYYAHRLFMDGKEITDLVVPDGVTSIKNRAFEGCTCLTSVTIPNSVTSLGEHVFQGCSNLTSATISNSNIGFAAFEGCSSLTSVTIGTGVKVISYHAFQNCPELADVYCYAENIPTTYGNTFDGSYINYATLYVPEASVAAYKAAEPWSGFGTIKTLTGEIPVVEKCVAPTISFVDGRLKFSCETEGVEYVYNVTPPSAKAGSGNDVMFSTTYRVTVYATKDGYENSDIVTKEINVGGMSDGKRGDVNLDGEVGMPDVMFIVNRILNGTFPDEE